MSTPLHATAQSPSTLSAPSAADAEFWRSAECIGTVDAFRAYLKAYPQGFYADLARAAIDRLGADSPRPGTSSNGPTVPLSVPLRSGLRVDPMPALAGVPTNGAITMQPGETYHGPGPITVGYLGAKKQLVLPNGPWVFLAVADRQSAHRPPVPLVSMVFGQFRDGRLMSLTSYLFNGRTAPLRTWQEVDDCHAEKRPRGSVGESVDQRGRRICGWTVRMSGPANVTDSAWEEAQRVVLRLGAEVPAPPLLFTRAFATDNAGNYLAIRRSDFLSAVAGTPDDSTTSLSARAAWLRDYMPLMMEGLDKRLGATELEPNQSQPPRVRVTLPN